VLLAFQQSPPLFPILVHDGSGVENGGGSPGYCLSRQARVPSGVRRATSVRRPAAEQGDGHVLRNGPKGASWKRCPSPFSAQHLHGGLQWIGSTWSWNGRGLSSESGSTTSSTWYARIGKTCGAGRSRRMCGPSFAVAPSAPAANHSPNRAM